MSSTPPAVAVAAPFFSWIFAAYPTLCFIPLVIKPSRYRWLYFLPILFLSYKALHSTTGNITNDYGLGCAWFTLFFISSDFILLTNVQRELQSIKPPQTKGSISDVGLRGRISWAWDLLTSVRGIGWAHGPSASSGILPPRPNFPSTRKGRLQFICNQIISLVFLGILFDLAIWHNSSLHPAFFRDGPSLFSYSWFWRYECIWGWAVAGYATLAAQNCVVGIISVSLGRSDPEDWPWLFGSIWDAWTVRRFWGRTWHQILRRFVTAHGRFLSRRILHLTPGTQICSCVRLYTAFLISGIIHYLADYMVLRNWEGGAMKFFLAQAVAITFEDGVIAVGRRFGLGDKNVIGWRLVGYAWVWTWFALVWPYFQEPLMRAGMIEDGANTSRIQMLWNSWRYAQA